MTTLATRYASVSALRTIAAAMHDGARRLRVGAGRLHEWLERRDAGAESRHALAAMSDHELFDIGLTRADVGGPGLTAYERVANPGGGLLAATVAERGAIIRAGAWLHAGLVGACVAAGGVVHTIRGDGTWLASFVMIAIGGVAAVESWRRGRAALEPSD